MQDDPVRKLKRLEELKLRMLLKTIGIRRLHNFSSATQLTRRTIMKWSYVRPTEARTLKFISENTAIPVPRVLDLYKFNGRTCLLMEYIDGRTLSSVWNKLSHEEKLSCMGQLSGYLSQLRALECPEPGKVQAVDGRGCWDCRIEKGEWGPFESHAAFTHFIYYDSLCELPDEYPLAQQPLEKIKDRTWRTVFTHGDLAPHNILWKDGKIVAIIDWEMSGWFPEYWEYTRSYFGCHERLMSWWDAFQDVTQAYPDELEVEKVIASYFTRI